MSAPRYRGFNSATLAFLRELEANNNREWFKLNKSRYEEHVLDVALQFIESMQRPLANIAPEFVAMPTRVGGSLMRVYKDARFAKGKSPYKTNIGIQFRHELGKDVHAPAYYVHIEADSAFLAAGMWRPESDSLLAIRQRIVARPAEWQRILAEPAFKRHFRLTGESLVRPPRGFDKNHECIEDIKRKSFIAVKDIDVESCLNPRFQQKVETAFAAADGLMRFLCKAVAVPF
tara:strand:+ start:910 stop:1605 length:696 start_codon:yes stop_codon:yes gene_type:complete